MRQPTVPPGHPRADPGGFRSPTRHSRGLQCLALRQGRPAFRPQSGNCRQDHPQVGGNRESQARTSEKPPCRMPYVQELENERCGETQQGIRAPRRPAEKNRLRAGPEGQERVVGRHPHVVQDDEEPPLVGFAQELVAPPLGHQPGGDVEILVVDCPLFLLLCMSWIV